MNALGQSLLGVAKGYLGPAAQSFLSAEFHAMGVNANSVTEADVAALSTRVRERAARVMGERKASDLADALARVHGVNTASSGGNRLANDAAAKLLATGKLRQAEKAYLELVAKHGTLSAYTGLARTQATLEDETSAMNTLRDGAAKFARAGDRGSAVSLLAEAVKIAPADLSAHRRLAAALANQGDLPGAVAEYARFVDVALQAHDTRRALIELAYGRETLGDLSGLAALVDRVTASHSRADAPQPPKREPPTLRFDAALPVHVEPAPQAVHHEPTPVPVRVEAKPAPVRVEAKPAPVRGEAKPLPVAPKPVRVEMPAAPAPKPAPIAPRPAGTPDSAWTQSATVASENTTHVVVDDASPIDVLSRAGVIKRLERPAAAMMPRPLDIESKLSSLLTTGSGIEAAASAASRAALLTGAHDARATEAVLDAARRLLALGKLQSASDVLLDFIGHGFTDREAQRLLIEVDCALGRRDVAKEKCNLLSHAYRLDGHTDVAEDVERLARIL